MRHFDRKRCSVVDWQNDTEHVAMSVTKSIMKSYTTICMVRNNGSVVYVCNSNAKIHNEG